jgi:hypothetical protein
MPPRQGLVAPGSAALAIVTALGTVPTEKP